MNAKRNPHPKTNRRPRENGQSGLAAVELGLVLPLMALVLFLIVEGANVVHVRHELGEAAREGARMALRQDATTQVEPYVHLLIKDLVGDKSVSVVEIPDTSVTVKVEYDYESFFGGQAFLQALGFDAFKLQASNTMPLS